MVEQDAFTLFVQQTLQGRYMPPTDAPRDLVALIDEFCPQD